MMGSASGRKTDRLADRIATAALWALAGAVCSLILYLLWVITSRGLMKITPHFLVAPPQELEAGGGIGPFLFNSFYVLTLSMLMSVPIGIGAGLYLAEFARDTRATRLIRMSVESLASVPSIIFGLFGMALFVDLLQVGLTILGASVSLALLNLPVLTRVTEEAVRAVPRELREAAYALGAVRHQCVLKVVFPAALGGIVTGIGLVAGRAFGESAVILLTAGTSASDTYWDFSLFSSGGTLAVHLWYVQAEAIVSDAREIADKASAVLVAVTLMFSFILRIPLMLSRRLTGQ